MHQQVTYQFCPVCGGRLTRRSVKAREPDRLVCTRCEFVFFEDPKVATGTIVPLNGGIVLVRRGIHPGYGKWVFPGGFVDRGEVVTDAAVREAKEETNLDVRVRRLLNVYSYAGLPVVVVVYEAEVVGGELRGDDECLEVRAFAPSEIPWDDLAFPSTRQALADFLERERQRA